MGSNVAPVLAEGYKKLCSNVCKIFLELNVRVVNVVYRFRKEPTLLHLIFKGSFAIRFGNGF